MAKRQVRNRIFREFTPEESARWEAGVAWAEANKDELIREGLRLKAVMEEQSPAGDLRRAIRGSDLEYEELAERAGISEETLLEFQRGERELAPETFERLSGVLGLPSAPPE